MCPKAQKTLDEECQPQTWAQPEDTFPLKLRVNQRAHDVPNIGDGHRLVEDTPGSVVLRRPRPSVPMGVPQPSSRR